jgi:transposase-like protein
MRRIAPITWPLSHKASYKPFFLFSPSALCIKLLNTGFREILMKYNCENRASILRPWLSVYRGVSKDNLDTYLSLFQLQRNTNKQPTIEKIKTIVKI